MSDTFTSLTAAVAMLLRPLVRMLQRSGVPYSVFADIAKRTYVEVAQEQFLLPGRKQSVSRISILTGLTRKEVSRLQTLPCIAGSDALDRYNRAARVIAGWVRDREFSSADGPCELPLHAQGVPNFAALVRRYSGDMPPRAMLDELQRVGAVECVNDSVRLVGRAYVPRSGEHEKLAILGSDVADLINTIDHNICTIDRSICGAPPRFQRKVAYDNLPMHALTDLRALSRERGQALIEDLDRAFARADRDTNRAQRGTGRVRAGVGVYYFEETVGTD